MTSFILVSSTKPDSHAVMAQLHMLATAVLVLLLVPLALPLPLRPGGLRQLSLLLVPLALPLPLRPPGLRQLSLLPLGLPPLPPGQTLHHLPPLTLDLSLLLRPLGQLPLLRPPVLLLIL